MPIYSADAIANEFIDLKKDQEITPMKLQKLVYYAHAWSLALFNEPLIKDRIEAWQYGPVVPTLYDEFRDFGQRGIDRFATELNDDLEEYPPRIDDSDQRSKRLVKLVWEHLGKYSAVQLSNMTHQDNEPWKKIPKKRPGLAIPDDLIKTCFQKIMAQR